MRKRFVIALTSCFVVLSACYSEATMRPEIVLSVHDGAVWVEPDEIPRYRCRDGRLFCETAGGRVAMRRCRCID